MHGARAHAQAAAAEAVARLQKEVASLQPAEGGNEGGEGEGGAEAAELEDGDEVRGSGSQRG